MDLNNPALTFTLALAAGITAQVAARHLRVPGIILLLAAGALLGPDVLDVVRPDTLGVGLNILVGLSVAVILFEGGLNLSVTRLRREARVIRLLITLGAAVTWVGAAGAARYFMGWPWPIAVTFGALVVVTGPTVITPLLRRVRVRHNVSTILEAEGVLIDPIGAIAAVVTLEIVLTETAGGVAMGLLGLPARLLLGTAIGIAGGLLIALVLRARKFVPEGLESVFTLSLVLLLFQVSDSIQHESGILESAVAGLVAANVAGGAIPAKLREFKEELTVLLVGLLFVLLAADVRLAELGRIGWSGIAVVAVLMLVVRPVAVALCTWGSALTWKERTFIAWLGPRGIVAAAVASVFADRFLAAGYDVGGEFRAMVFLVIAVTVAVQGFTSGPVASVLGVRRPTDRGYVIVGANPLSRTLAGALGSAGEDVVLIDTNAVDARTAEEEGLRVILGDAKDEAVLVRADVEGRRGFLTTTSNESANILLARAAKEEFTVPYALAAMEREQEGPKGGRTRIGEVGMLFGRPFDIAEWIHALRHDGVVERWRLQAEPSADAIGTGPTSGTEGTEGTEGTGDAEDANDNALPLVVVRDGSGRPVAAGTRFRPGDVVAFAFRGSARTPPSVRKGEWVPA